MGDRSAENLNLGVRQNDKKNKTSKRQEKPTSGAYVCDDGAPRRALLAARARNSAFLNVWAGFRAGTNVVLS